MRRRLCGVWLAAGFAAGGGLYGGSLLGELF
jgi:hypothetical protein